MSRSPINGGWPARRAVVRWAARLLRREWRQHVLILSLLTLAVAGAIGFSCAIHNLASGTTGGEFGDANHSFSLVDPDPLTLPAELERAAAWFGAIDVTRHTTVPVPGSVKNLDLRAQDPAGPFGRPLLDLRTGRYPVADDEVAMTEGAVELLGTSIGQAVELGGRPRHVVGLVENPRNLDDDFVLAPPTALTAPQSVVILVDATDDRVGEFRPPDGVWRISSSDEVPQDLVAAIIALVVGTLVLFLVALIAAASFAVIAQRRLPQLGMLAAVGGTEKHLRLTMLASGAVTGIIAAGLGAAIGLAGWFVVEPLMEAGVGRRIDPNNIPWWLVIAGMILAVAAATAAAWWPGRTMSRTSPMLALSGRTPRPAALHRNAFAAAVALAVGVACLYIGSRTLGHRVSGGQMVLLGVGTVAFAAGVLLLGPIAVRGVTRVAGHVPVGPRLALRDLGRYQARSGAAVAAISLAVGIPATVVAVSAAAAHGAGPGNLPATQVLVSKESAVPFVPESDDLPALQAGVDALSSTLPDAKVVRLDVAKDPRATRDPRLPGIEPILVGYPVEEGWHIVSPVYVATPDLLAAMGLGPGDVTAGHDVVTSEGVDIQILTGAPEGPDDRGWDTAEHVATTGRLPATYTALPRALIGVDGARERGWGVVPSGQWIIETPDPLTGEELSVLRDVAARHGLVVESRDVDAGLEQLRFGAVAVGILLALGILAMTIGLLRAESAGDMRTLTATGASSGVRRVITASTAAALAALGVALGIAGAYLGLAVGRVPNLLPVPALDLLAIAAGLPLAAAAAGGLLAGREPKALARRPIE
jgi:putative ABC transport system permease protein